MSASRARRASVAVAAVLALTGSAAPHPAGAADDAATVNDETIAVDEFEELATSLADAGITDFAADPASQTLGAEAGRFLLGILVTNAAGAQLFDALGEPPIGEEEIEAAISGRNDPAVASLTGDARTAIGTYFAISDRLAAMPAPEVDTLGDYYEEAPARLGVYCTTAVLVADAQSADAVAVALDVAEPSWDAVSAIGGADVADWACTELSTVTDPALRDELVAAAPGDVVGPVSTGDGFAVLVVDSFDTAADKLENFFLRLEAEGQTAPGTVLLQGFLLTSDITVDSRYGRWDPQTATIVPLGA